MSAPTQNVRRLDWNDREAVEAWARDFCTTVRDGIDASDDATAPPSKRKLGRESARDIIRASSSKLHAAMTFAGFDMDRWVYWGAVGRDVARITGTIKAPAAVSPAWASAVYESALRAINCGRDATLPPSKREVGRAYGRRTIAVASSKLHAALVAVGGAS